MVARASVLGEVLRPSSCSWCSASTSTTPSSTSRLALGLAGQRVLQQGRLGAQVRAHGKTEQVQEQVKTKEQLESDEIEALLKEEFKEEAEKSEELVESLEEKKLRLETELREVERLLAEQSQSVEKSIEKLTERNMLGRLAKSLRLNEAGKQKMFNYFDKGEL